jgi:hypothetical protein
VIFFFFFDVFMSQSAVKLSVLYREYQEYLKEHPQELSEMRMKLQSLEREVTSVERF